MCSMVMACSNTSSMGASSGFIESIRFFMIDAAFFQHLVDDLFKNERKMLAEMQVGQLVAYA